VSFLAPRVSPYGAARERYLKAAPIGGESRGFDALENDLPFPASDTPATRLSGVFKRVKTPLWRILSASKERFQ